MLYTKHQMNYVDERGKSRLPWQQMTSKKDNLFHQTRRRENLKFIRLSLMPYKLWQEPAGHYEMKQKTGEGEKKKKKGKMKMESDGRQRSFAWKKILNWYPFIQRDIPSMVFLFVHVEHWLLNKQGEFNGICTTLSEPELLMCFLLLKEVFTEWMLLFSFTILI